MIREANEKEILDRALAAFTRQTGCSIAGEAMREGGTFHSDATVELQSEHGPVPFITVVKARVTAVETLQPLFRLPQQPEEFLLVTRQLTGDMADRLKNNGIQFIDTAGNTFINRPPYFIFIKGNRDLEAVKQPVLGRVFKQTGLRALYALLCTPGLENEPYRIIAAKTGVALGMVNWIMRELRELGFLLERGKRRERNTRLINREKLLERWITAYVEQLRPKLVYGRYRGPDNWWQHAKLNPEKALWGGEVAAAKLTGYLNPQEITVYIDKNDPTAMLIPNRLKKDPGGDVELLYRFWHPETVPANGDMAHPLLVYADLLATGNQRNLETARMIYDQHIVQLVREA
jgi:hypothetical protein